METSEYISKTHCDYSQACLSDANTPYKSKQANVRKMRKKVPFKSSTSKQFVFLYAVNKSILKTHKRQ